MQVPFTTSDNIEQKTLVSQEFLIKRSEESMPPMTTILPELPDYYDGQDYADYDTFLTHDENKNSILDNSINNDYYSNLNPNKIQKTDRDRLTPLYGSPNDELPADSTDMNSNANNNNNSFLDRMNKIIKPEPILYKNKSLNEIPIDQEFNIDEYLKQYYSYIDEEETFFLKQLGKIEQKIKGLKGIKSICAQVRMLT